MRVALLGGTTEARELASRLVGADIEVETSFAGRTAAPLLPAGTVRRGGFGGVDALAQYLAAFDLVVDATHPFATLITARAVAAAALANRPLLVLRRPGWIADGAAGDDWRRVPSAEAAAELVASLPVDSVLLTIGQTGVAAFADNTRQQFTIRAVERNRLETPLPPRHSLLLDRGPFTEDGERALFTRLGIGVVVTKDSGGEATRAKLVAARELAVPVVMIDRPPLPGGVEAVDSVAAALEWVTSR